jgi:hypothetical protein
VQRHKVKVGMTVYLHGLPSLAGVPGKVVRVETRFGHFLTFLVRWRGRRTPSPHPAGVLRPGPPPAVPREVVKRKARPPVGKRRVVV